MTESWNITDDTELKKSVYGETQYNTKKLSDSDLDEIIDSAKRILALKANVSSFYDDQGITLALEGLVKAKSKGAVENSPVRAKNIAGQDTTLRTSDGSSLQLSEYEDMIETGLAESNKSDAGPHKLGVTNTYLSDSSSR